MIYAHPHPNPLPSRERENILEIWINKIIIKN
jgi:hypothetical protein